MTEELLAVIIATCLLVLPASAAGMRMQDRSLYVANNEPGATTSYTVSLRYMSPEPVGSLDLRFCINPIPYTPCVTPPGLDISDAELSSQTGETGFTIRQKTANRIVIGRTALASTAPLSSYTFTGIKNPTYQAKSFSIRLASYGTNNATGPQIDFGSIKTQIQRGIEIQAQVPPMLIFCVAQEVAENCTSTNETFYTDMGELSANSTLKAQSQMAVGTNASGGFAITANGATMGAGDSEINALAVPTKSTQGENQFGINLVENTQPAVGANPEGVWTNAVPAASYNIPNEYKYVDGELVASSPNVSLMKKFTVSYVINSEEDLRPGVYSTTITYIASGRF